VGPRYLVAALPFLVFPFVFQKGGMFESALVGAATFATCTTSLAFPYVPPGFAVPWATFSGFFFERGLTGPNALHLVAPVAARFVLPAIVGVAAYFFLEGKREEKRGGRRRAVFAFSLGVAACAAIGCLFYLSKPLPLSLLLQRAYIADVYFERRGMLEEEIARTGSPQPRLLARRERELALPPPSWPFSPASR
jgi:hypothetical protein